MAIGSMTTNSTVDVIDKTLAIPGAPADAAATGAALNKKVNKDVILDPEGNVLFYSKAAVDELLAGKLDLTGGTMTGELGFISGSGGDNGSILPGDEDAANVPGGPLNNLVIRSWWGVSFTTDCPNFPYTGKTAVSIDCRNGIIKAPRFEGAADNGVVASGSDYVRFGDGTQICWALIKTPQLTSLQYGIPKRVTFPVAFANTDYGIASCFTFDIGWGGGLKIHSADLSTTYADIKFMNTSTDTIPADSQFRLIFIGRWK